LTLPAGLGHACAVGTRPPVFVGSGFVAKYPTGGGNFWVPLQYVLGLRALGVEAYWLELLWPQGDVERARRFVPTFRRYVEDAGVAEHTALVLFPENDRDDAPGREEQTGGPTDLWERARDGILLNVAHSVPAPLRDRFARRVLFDVDPGQFQLWARQFELGVGSHDAYLTIGQNLGAPDCPVPLDGVPWQRVWPAVHLPAWPVQASPGTRWTTVTQWWSEGWTILGDEVIEGHKRSSFLRVVDLPRHVSAAFELAANIHPDETADLDLLRRHGWSVVDPAVVAGTPPQFRAYVQGSRGEFSCAKPSYVRTRPGWVSDRTVCYLASGRPCVVERTGAERHLPDSAGLRFFATTDEAAAAVAAIEADYLVASRAARALAEEVFSATVVLPALLHAAGVS
jgi:hypothetical protein